MTFFLTHSHLKDESQHVSQTLKTNTRAHQKNHDHYQHVQKKLRETAECQIEMSTTTTGCAARNKYG